MHIRVIDWGEQAVFRAWWRWWGGKGWCDLSGSNSIQCHITAQLNHLQSWVEQVIMSLPIGPKSITWWMWPLQTYRVTVMVQFHLDPPCGPALSHHSETKGSRELLLDLIFWTDFIGSDARICYSESVPGSSLEFNITEAVTEHRNTAPFQELDINQKIEKLCSILCIVQNPLYTAHSRLSVQQFSQWQWSFMWARDEGAI